MIMSFLTSLFGVDEPYDNRSHDFGYRVIQVKENSPSFLASIQPYFDFIVKINEVELTQDPRSLLDTLQLYASAAINLTLFSVKDQRYRNLTLRRGNWTGESILGVNVYYSSISDAERYVWHVLEVYYGSPADIAGLRPYSDYIVAGESLFEHDNALCELIENNESQPIIFVVYNCETDAFREVTVVPNRRWRLDSQGVSDDSLLGCGIGFGLLHRIPNAQTQVENPVEFKSETVAEEPVIEKSIIESVKTEVAQEQVFVPSAAQIPDQSTSTYYESQYQQEGYYNPYDYQVIPNPYHEYPYVPNSQSNLYYQSSDQNPTNQ